MFLISALRPPQPWIPRPQVRKPSEEGWKEQPPPEAVPENLQKAVWAEGWLGIPTQRHFHFVGSKKHKGGRPTTWWGEKAGLSTPIWLYSPSWGEGRPVSLSPAKKVNPWVRGCPILGGRRAGRAHLPRSVRESWRAGRPQGMHCSKGAESLGKPARSQPTVAISKGTAGSAEAAGRVGSGPSLTATTPLLQALGARVP